MPPNVTLVVTISNTFNIQSDGSFVLTPIETSFLRFTLPFLRSYEKIASFRKVKKGKNLARGGPKDNIGDRSTTKYFYWVERHSGFRQTSLWPPLLDKAALPQDTRLQPCRMTEARAISKSVEEREDFPLGRRSFMKEVREARETRDGHLCRLTKVALPF
jgi:hypothetical protein